MDGCRTDGVLIFSVKHPDIIIHSRLWHRRWVVKKKKSVCVALWKFHREIDNRETARSLTVDQLPVITECEEKKEALSAVGLI